MGVDVQGPDGVDRRAGRGDPGRGGFNRHPGLRERLIPDRDTTPGAPGNRGGLIALALELGARLGDEGQGHASGRRFRSRETKRHAGDLPALCWIAPSPALW